MGMGVGSHSIGRLFPARPGRQRYFSEMPLLRADGAEMPRLWFAAGTTCLVAPASGKGVSGESVAGHLAAVFANGFGFFLEKREKRAVAGGG